MTAPPAAGMSPAGGPERCGICGALRGGGRADGCVGWLDGVAWACCGHGADDRRYVSTTTGRLFNGFGAFRRHQEWLATPDARMALRCDELAGLFGWEQARRSACRRCGLPGYECTCRSPSR